MKRKITTSLFFCLFLINLAISQTGYEIRVKAENYPMDEMSLAYYLGEKSFLISGHNTVKDEGGGSFVFKGNELLKSGLYFLAFSKDYERNGRKLDIYLEEKNQKFDISFNYASVYETIQFKGSEENKLAVDYLLYLDKKRNEMSELSKSSASDMTKSSRTEVIFDEITAYQKQLFEKLQKSSLVSAIIRSGLPIQYPEFKGTEEEKQFKAWQYTKKHFFDNTDLGDPKLLRTPMLFEKVNYYINKLTVQHPDSINKSIDVVLQKMKPAPDTYQYYITYFLNKNSRTRHNGSRSTDLITSDEIYVHMADSYYRTGRADWIEGSDLKRIIDFADALKPILVGKTAPNMALEDISGNKIDFYDFKCKNTVLFLWSYNNVFARSDIKGLQRISERLYDYEVKVLAVTVDEEDKIQDCWNYVNAEKLENLTHVKGYPENSIINKKYSTEILSIPQIYILDENKNIIAKSQSMDNILDVIKELNNDSIIR